MIKKVKSHKDVQLPFGSGKTDTRPWVPRDKPIPQAKHKDRPAAHDVNGGDLAKGGSPYKEEKDYDKDWPPKPKPVKA